VTASLDIERELYRRRGLLHPADIAAEIDRRAKVAAHARAVTAARGDLLAFVRLAHPNYEAGWFHSDVCAALERFSAAVAARQSPRLMLFAPPRHGKTAIVSQRWPVWHLGRNPGHEIVCASYGQELADDNSRAARSVARDQSTMEVFPSLGTPRVVKAKALAPTDLDQVAHWRVGNGGSYKAVGVGGPLTGRGAHILIIDDPVKDQASADSPAVRKACVDWYKSTARTRLAPGGGVLLMMTRWHAEDLAGVILAEAAADPNADQWQVARYRAIADEDEAHRATGEALHPARYPVPELLKIRATLGPRIWRSLYDQNPVPDSGNMIRAEWFATRYSCRPEDIATTADSVWVTSDAAKKPDGSSDFHAIQVWARKGAKRTLLDRRTERMGYPGFEAALDGMIYKWLPHLRRTAGAALVEDTANGTTYIQCRAHLSPVPIIAFHPSSDTPGQDKSKQARAVYVQRAAEAGQIELPAASVCPWVEDYVCTLTAFPLGAHDDDMDATSQLLMRWALEDTQPTLAASNASLSGWFGV